MRGKLPLPALTLLALTLAGCGDADRPGPGARGAIRLHIEDAQPHLDAFVRTEMEVLATHTVAVRAVERLELHRDEGFTGSRIEVPAPVAADTVVSRTAVTRRDGTFLVDVSVQDEDTARAARICNAVLEVYVELRLEDRVAPLLQALELLDGERVRTRARVEEAEAALESHRRAHPPDLDPTSRLDRARLERAAASERATLEELEARIRQQQTERATLTAPVTVVEPCRPQAP